MPHRPHAFSDRCSTSGSGFTLIELVAVMIVVAILAATAAASLSSLTDTRTGAAAQRVLRDLTFARQRAVATGTRSWVVFNVAGDSYQILAEDPANPGRAGATVLEDPAQGQPMTVTFGSDEYVGVSLSTASFDGGAEIGFDWLGAPLNDAETPLAAAGSITLPGGYSLAVSPVSGHVALTTP